MCGWGPGWGNKQVLPENDLGSGGGDKQMLPGNNWGSEE